jgi:mono/diheme cytochrome c family protein
LDWLSWQRIKTFCSQGQYVRRFALERNGNYGEHLIMKSATRIFAMLCCFVWCLAGAPSPASASEGSLARAGAEIYAQRCSGCHGEDLHNVSGGWSFDLRRLRPDEHDRFVDSVTSGKDNMPSWYGILKSEEIEAIWAYIRATVDKQ